MIQFLPKYRRFDETKIRQLQSLLGFAIPLDYTDFLRTVGGGVPGPNHYKVGDESSEVLVFFGQSDIKGSSLFDMVARCGDLVAKNNLPIARDISGELICLSGFPNGDSSIRITLDYSDGSELETAHLNCSFTSFLESIEAKANLETLSPAQIFAKCGKPSEAQNFLSGTQGLNAVLHRGSTLI